MNHIQLLDKQHHEAVTKKSKFRKPKNRLELKYDIEFILQSGNATVKDLKDFFNNIPDDADSDVVQICTTQPTEIYVEIFDKGF